MQADQANTLGRRRRIAIGLFLALFAGVLGISAPVLLNAMGGTAAGDKAANSAASKPLGVVDADPRQYLQYLHAGQHGLPERPTAAGGQRGPSGDRAAGNGEDGLTFGSDELLPAFEEDYRNDPLTYYGESNSGSGFGGSFAGGGGGGVGSPPAYYGADNRIGGMNTMNTGGGGGSGGGSGEEDQWLPRDWEQEPLVAVPEPGTVILLLLGLGAMISLRRKGGRDS